jgi:hypothetical protein
MANPAWTVLPLESFELALPEEPGELGAVLLIHARPNGRLMDHFRFSVGGSRILDVVTTTRTLFSSEMLPDTRISFQIRPAEIGIRLNQITSEWIDVVDNIKSRDFLAGDNPDDDDNDELVALLESIEDTSEVNASIRWAIGVTSERTMELVLQALPASADTLNGKPT